jgi:ABC-type phosphate/phosphonate transport system substrate-binding protein
MSYVANARMYSVNPAAAAAWKELFEWLAQETGVELTVVDHAFPKPLAELWSRPDLACAFMCGFPYALAKHPPQAVATLIPSAAPIAGRPVYATRLVVRADSGFHALEDTFDGRLGFTVEDSHSGYNALRHHLLPYYKQRGAKLYQQSIGPLFTPRRVIESVTAGTIDVGPLDSYALDLMMRHEPELASQIRIIATTAPAPMPLLVAAADCPHDIIAALRRGLHAFGGAAACSGLRGRLCLDAFAPVVDDDYQLTLRWDQEARETGYGQPA